MMIQRLARLGLHLKPRSASAGDLPSAPGGCVQPGWIAARLDAALLAQGFTMPFTSSSASAKRRFSTFTASPFDFWMSSAISCMFATARS